VSAAELTSLNASLGPLVPAVDPLVKFRGYQAVAFWKSIRMLFLLWRRQAGKSFTLANKALYRMMTRRDHLCIFCSASIVLGSEFIRKEAEVWQSVMAKYRAKAKEENLLFESNADGLDLDAVCDLFEHEKLETRIYHDRTSYSRSRVVAPNPATAVGWTGDVYFDEVGRMPGLKELLEAVGPIFESNPEFIMWMATTPPPDDSHYSFELFQPKVEEFPLNARGNFYESPSGVLVHRFDAYDAELAGVRLHHPKTGEKISPEEHRALAFDKTAWDRNFGLKFIPGGAAAISAAALMRAMIQGKGKGLAIDVTEVICL
jgi:hypothetical protein